jgi:hypothetical protein
MLLTALYDILYFIGENGKDNVPVHLMEKMMDLKSSIEAYLE